MEPGTQDGQEMMSIDRFGKIVPSARFDTPLSITFHSLGRYRDDRQLTTRRYLACLAHGGYAIHLWHHDVHEYNVDR